MTDSNDNRETDYEVGQDNVQPFGLDIHNPVFAVSAITIVAFVFFSLVFKEQAGEFFGWLRPTLTSNFDWVFMIACNIFVVFCLFLIVTPYGSIRLGGDNARPDYSYMGWFSMLFAAGMGIGLVFWGVAEPISHYGSSLGGTAVGDAGVRTDWAPLGAAAGDPEAARDLAMAATIFHWGLHPWAIYAVVALALAFFSFNRGLPLTMRSVFYPLFGEATWGPLGHIIDVLAVFATIFGLATSLGLGATQALAGLNYLFGVPVTDGMKVLLIIAITLFALVSVVAGLDKGVKRLSEANMILAAALLILVLLVGPTLLIISGFFSGLGEYIVRLPALSNWVGREDTNFMQGWTTFYWAWWISWSPFVGMFIARISRGRTIREFIVCVLLIPTLVGALWMSVFGGAALDQVMSGAGEALSAAGLELKMFTMFEAFPMTSLLSFVGIVLVVVFFVTSSDSGSLVIDTITAGGKTDAPTAQRVFWCVLEGAIAIVLLLGGGLGALQAAAIATGFPFAIVLVLMCLSIFIGLVNERRRK
ncbi:BCCT family transporter [Thalassovita mediterranea]|jgi:BCCT family betaine/carnitine transporter|uniref:Glycine betaine-Na(+) symporter n=1 Tax=Thalassovita mediterranea TaxID=340021 RepID=A0A0P1GQ89_9RHOB|nr:BCCT family transporter [Thalassovita mediterranea]MCG7574066.1 BCCT family transporter [Phaeobacter sp. CNT1-3]CUH84751.1 Glycine betaine-Na(+) symporter [Thalassovita mediterranea]SIS32486.1 betaine/carnitine transporter, BCCT family [Thalassovita mediterranea]